MNDRMNAIDWTQVGKPSKRRIAVVVVLTITLISAMSLGLNYGDIEHGTDILVLTMFPFLIIKNYGKRRHQNEIDFDPLHDESSRFALWFVFMAMMIFMVAQSLRYKLPGMWTPNTDDDWRFLIFSSIMIVFSAEELRNIWLAARYGTKANEPNPSVSL